MGLNLVRKTLVLVKSETTYGTDPTPTAGSDAMLLYGDGNVIKPDIKLIDRKPLRASFTKRKKGIGRHKWNFTPQTILMSKGVSTGYGAPFFGPLLKASGWAAASGSGGGSSSTVYTPSSSAPVSATAWVYADGILKKATGLYGGFQLKMVAGDDPTINFTMDGRYAEPTSVSFPAASSITYPTDTSVMVQSLGLSIGSYGDAEGLICREVMFDSPTTRADRGSVNHTYGWKGTHITDRDMSMELLVEYEDTLSNKNFWSDLSNSVSSNAITFTHGDATQSKIVFSVPTPQPISITPEDDQGIRMMRVKYDLSSITDDREATISFVEKT